MTDIIKIINNKINELRDEMIVLQLEKQFDYQTSVTIKLVQIDTLEGILKETKEN